MVVTIEEVIILAEHRTCRVRVAGAKVLIPLVLLSFGIVAVTDSPGTKALEPTMKTSTAHSANLGVQDDSQTSEDENEEPAIELPLPYSLLVDAAKRHSLDPALVLAVAATESNFNVDAVSSRGAIGLMQLMPTTAQEMGVNPYVLEENVEGGVMYLAKLVKKYENVNMALAAYNAGMGVVDRYGGVPPFKETQNYVKRVMRRYGEFTNNLTQLAMKS